MNIETHADTQMPLRIARVEDVADGIRAFELVQADGSELPPFTPGAAPAHGTPAASQAMTHAVIDRRLQDDELNRPLPLI